jgi:hypothetical protein
VEANSTGGQGSRRAVAPSDDDESLAFGFCLLSLLHRILSVHINEVLLHM